MDDSGEYDADFEQRTAEFQRITTGKSDDVNILRERYCLAQTVFPPADEKHTFGIQIFIVGNQIDRLKRKIKPSDKQKSVDD